MMIMMTILFIHVDAHLRGMFLGVSQLHPCLALLYMPDPLPIPLLWCKHLIHHFHFETVEHLLETS